MIKLAYDFSKHKLTSELDGKNCAILIERVLLREGMKIQTIGLGIVDIERGRLTSRAAPGAPRDRRTRSRSPIWALRRTGKLWASGTFIQSSPTRARRRSSSSSKWMARAVASERTKKVSSSFTSNPTLAAVFASPIVGDPVTGAVHPVRLLPELP